MNNLKCSNEDLIIRPYHAGDEGGIIELYKNVFKKEKGFDYWQWKYKDNPLGKALIAVLVHKSKIVGHYAVVPVKTLIAGREILCGLSVWTMIHEDYRGLDRLIALAKVAYQICVKAGIEMVYGFPNDNIYLIRTKRLGWQDYGDIRWYKCDLNSIRENVVVLENVVEVPLFDNKVNDLWKSSCNKDEATIVRDDKYLNWRFSNPTANYKKYVYARAGGQLEGYIVLKIFDKNNIREGQIVDLFSTGKEVSSILICRGIEYFKENNIEGATAWILNKGNQSYGAMLEAGFKETKNITHFGGRVLGDTSIQKLIAKSHWYMTMSDSDVF